MNMKGIFAAMMAGACLGMSSAVCSYDMQMAESYGALFAPVAGANAGKALHLMAPPALIKDVIDGKEFVTLDVRTPAETGVFAMTLPNSLVIPMDRLFQTENLARIPTDKPVVIICQSGIRSVAAGTALRHIGFKNVFILKGGLKALSSFLGPKQAYPKPASMRTDESGRPAE